MKLTGRPCTEEMKKAIRITLSGPITGNNCSSRPSPAALTCVSTSSRFWAADVGCYPLCANGHLPSEGPNVPSAQPPTSSDLAPSQNESSSAPSDARRAVSYVASVPFQPVPECFDREYREMKTRLVSVMCCEFNGSLQRYP